MRQTLRGMRPGVACRYQCGPGRRSRAAVVTEVREDVGEVQVRIGMATYDAPVTAEARERWEEKGRAICQTIDWPDYIPVVRLTREA